MMIVSYCNRPQGKPKVCQDFPMTERMIEPYKDVCGFWFDDDGVRYGECNGCGECCKEVFLRLPEFDEKIRGERCPYLVELDSGD